MHFMTDKRAGKGRRTMLPEFEASMVGQYYNNGVQRKMEVENV